MEIRKSAFVTWAKWKHLQKTIAHGPVHEMNVNNIVRL